MAHPCTRRLHAEAADEPDSILVGAGCFASVAYYAYNISRLASVFPKPVANKLRRALYHTSIDVNPRKALDYYRQAIAAAAAAGMDPFGDEVIGIKLSCAAMLEKVGAVRNAIEVLEIVRNDCLEYVERREAEGEMGGERARVLAKTVGMAVKLGELYARPEVDDPEAAERVLVLGVETALREMQRREAEGERADEGPWLSGEELGGTLESLAEHYAHRSRHAFSAPLYLRALSLGPPPCHATVIMSNLALSLSQAGPAPSTDPSMPPTSRAVLVSNARQWAEKALSIAQTVKPPERTEECDVGCALATHNLGEFAEMEGALAEARRRYEEAARLSKAIGFREGIRHADEALERIRSKE
jgi:tetratricopeptide (TPR) repeat protein